MLHRLSGEWTPLHTGGGRANSLTCFLIPKGMIVYRQRIRLMGLLQDCQRALLEQKL